MKEITSVTSAVKHKLKKKSKKVKIHDSGKQNEGLTNFTNQNMKKKKVKKIKIRLADPDIPDSYICEVFDSSLEREEEEEERCRKESNIGFRGKDKSKQKNFFDVLMSKDLRRNFLINSAAQNEEIPEDTKLFREVENDDIVQKRKLLKAKRKEKLIKLAKSKNRKNNSYCGSTSDDESLFEVQSRLQLFATNSDDKNPSNSGAKAKNKENTVVAARPGPTPKSVTPFSVPKREGSNILHYFSRTHNRALKTPVKLKKPNGHLKPRKLTEINMFEYVRKERSSVGSTGEGVEGVKKTENVKLAPLFQKKLKTVVDPKVMQARLDFLHNGIPTNMKKISSCVKNMEDERLEFHFPGVSHVQQKDDDPLWLPEDIFIPFMKAEDDSVYKSRGKIFKFDIRDEGFSCIAATADQTNQSSLSSLRLRYKDIDIESIFNGFKQKKDNSLRKMEKCDNSDVSIEIVDDCEYGNGCSSLWTEVYRPKSDEIMGNKLTVARLSGWFRSWKEYSNEIKKLPSKVTFKTSSDESDAFVSSDGDITSLRSPVNVCLLSGPIASGKTALVYALAAEFDFNILEVNASSARTGKKLLLRVEEATKSHQVSSGLTSTITCERINEPKIKKKVKKKKKKRKSVDNASKLNSSQMSLILIEDADIVFEEHDEGFVSAISTLLQSSKRPFIFLSNDPNFSYLERLKQQKILVLEMRRPSFQNARAVLDVIASVEGVGIDRATLDNVIQGNDYDIRKSILEMQFWIQSGKRLVRNVGNASELGKLWWGLNKFLYNVDNAHVRKLDCRKRKRSNNLSDSDDFSEEKIGEAPKKAKLNAGLAKASKIKSVERKFDSSIHSYAGILDSILIGDLLKYDSDLEPIPSNECRPNDGLSLNEYTESVDWKVKDLTGLIIQQLVVTSARVFASRDGRDAHCMLSNPPWPEIRWRNIHKDAKKDLLSLLPPHGWNSKRNVHLDYLPVMRNMCRAEKSRYTGNTKRKNRFYHYFNTLGYHPRDESLDISCDIFTV